MERMEEGAREREVSAPGATLPRVNLGVRGAAVPGVSSHYENTFHRPKPIPLWLGKYLERDGAVGSPVPVKGNRFPSLLPATRHHVFLGSKDPQRTFKNTKIHNYPSKAT